LLYTISGKIVHRDEWSSEQKINAENWKLSELSREKEKLNLADMSVLWRNWYSLFEM
jgi:hypothetical protein